MELIGKRRGTGSRLSFASGATNSPICSISTESKKGTQDSPAVGLLRGESPLSEPSFISSILTESVHETQAIPAVGLDGKPVPSCTGFSSESKFRKMNRKSILVRETK